MQEQTILEHLTRIEKQLEIINSKIENFIGFEELTEEELEELDRIETEMMKGDKIPL
jgi:hypothetical protein